MIDIQYFDINLFAVVKNVIKTQCNTLREIELPINSENLNFIDKQK